MGENGEGNGGTERDEKKNGEKSLVGLVGPTANGKPRACYPLASTRVNLKILAS